MKPNCGIKAIVWKVKALSWQETRTAKRERDMQAKPNIK